MLQIVSRSFSGGILSSRQPFQQNKFESRVVGSKNVVGSSGRGIGGITSVRKFEFGFERKNGGRNLRAQNSTAKGMQTTDEEDRSLAANFLTSEGRVEEVAESEAEVDYLGESTEGDLMLVSTPTSGGVIDVLGLRSVEDVADVDYTKLHGATQAVLTELGIPPNYPDNLPQRGIYCSRTLNLRSIRCIGYDMDYTLIHYDVNAWEGKAYEYGIKTLREAGYPTDGLEFDPNLVIRGLIVDKELGNIVKIDRFGIVRRAMHGTEMLNMQQIREAYGRETVNLRNERRWYFLNTFFSVSEAVMFMQLVDLVDQEKIPFGIGGHSYPTLYNAVAKALYQTHVEGMLKEEIIQDPGSYIYPDPEMAETLLDQREAGKQLLLITNSDYEYTQKMMTFAYDRFLPGHMTWRDMFDMVIVNARKPDFFNHNNSLYEIVTPEGLMRPVLDGHLGGVYCGGSARQVERALGVEGDDILYVGDHIYTDAAMAKLNFRWRTALIIRELEKEICAVVKGLPHREKLHELMKKKDLIGDVFNHLRLGTRPEDDHSENDSAGGGQEPTILQSTAQSTRAGAWYGDEEARKKTAAQLLMLMSRLDAQIGPMLEQDGENFSSRWGYLCRAGLHDKSALCRAMEKWADIYTSRVSNFYRYTPFMYFRSQAQSLGHDRNLFDYRSNNFSVDAKENGADENGNS